MGLKRKQRAALELELITDDVLVFLRTFKPLECSCCELVIGFQNRTTGMIVCTPHCINLKRSMAPVADQNQKSSSASMSTTAVLPHANGMEHVGVDSGAGDGTLSMAALKLQHDLGSSTTTLSTTALPHDADDMGHVKEKLGASNETLLMAALKSQHNVMSSTATLSTTGPPHAELAEAINSEADDIAVLTAVLNGMQTKDRSGVSLVHSNSEEAGESDERVPLSFETESRDSSVTSNYKEVPEVNPFFKTFPRSKIMVPSQFSEAIKPELSLAGDDVFDFTANKSMLSLDVSKEAVPASAAVPLQPQVSKTSTTELSPAKDDVSDFTAKKSMVSQDVSKKTVPSSAVIPLQPQLEKTSIPQLSLDKEDVLDLTAKKSMVSLDVSKKATHSSTAVPLQVQVSKTTEPKIAPFKHDVSVRKSIIPLAVLNKKAHLSAKVSTQWQDSKTTTESKPLIHISKKTAHSPKEDDNFEHPANASVKSRDVTPPSKTVISKLVKTGPELTELSTSEVQKPKYTWLACWFSPNLVSGADVRVQFQWKINKYQVQAICDEDAIQLYQERVNSYVDAKVTDELNNLSHLKGFPLILQNLHASDSFSLRKINLSFLTVSHLAKIGQPMTRIPVLDEMVLGKYGSEYYRSRVKNVSPNGCLIDFVDYGDSGIGIFGEMYELNDELMKFPIWSMTVFLSKVPRDSSIVRIPKSLSNKIFSPLTLDFVQEELDLKPKADAEYEVKLWLDDDSTLNSLVLAVIKMVNNFD